MNQSIEYDIRELENLVFREETNVDKESLQEIDKFLSILNILGGNLPLLKGLSKLDKDLLSSNKDLLLDKIYSRLSTSIISLIVNVSQYNEEIEGMFLRILAKKSYLSSLLSSNIIGSTDHYIPILLNKHKIKPDNGLDNKKLFLLKLSCIYSLNSLYSIKDIIGYYNDHNNYLLNFIFGLLSENYVGSSLADANKDYLLTALPIIIDNIESKDDINNINLAQIAGPYMYCSYSSNEFRHKIKNSIHNLIRKFNIGIPLSNLESENLFNKETIYPKYKDKYCMFVIHENFASNHAIFRCYSKLINILSSKYYTIGISSFSNKIDEKAKLIFDEHYSLIGDSLNEKLMHLSNLSKEYLPRLVYYPSIGMDPLLIVTSSYRLGYKQIYTYGHPAPAFSPVLDAAIYESESNVQKDLDPYVKYIKFDGYSLMSLLDSSLKISPSWKISSSNKYKQNDKKINIAISASPAKLTSKFIDMINTISYKTDHNIEFFFFIAGPRLIVTQQIKNSFKELLKCSYQVINSKPYDEYLLELSKCHMFLSPFPFGSSNTLLDCFRVGLLGPCLTGDSFPQNSERIIYKNLNLDFLIAYSEEEYLELSLDLINEFFSSSKNNYTNFIEKYNPKDLIDLLCTTSLGDYRDELLVQLEKIF